MQLNRWFEYNWKAEFHTHENKHKYKSLSSIRKSDNKARLLAPSSLSGFNNLKQLLLFYQ